MTALDFCKKKIVKDCNIRIHKHAAIAFSKSGNVIASTVNKLGSGHVSDFSFHAEEDLIRKLRKLRARERFGYIRILVVRMPKGQEWGMSKPCDGCTRLIRAYGINDVSYTNEQGNIVNL